MAYKIDHVYESDGTELSNALHATTLVGSNNMEYDGRYLWVTCGANGIAIYEWWGAASDNEPPFEALDDQIYPQYDSGIKKKLRLVTYISISTTQLKRTTCLEAMQEAGATKYPQSTGQTAWAKVTARSGTALNAFYIKKCANKMYVSSTASFREIFEFNVETQNLIGVINVQETYTGITTEFFTNGTTHPMNSNLESAGTKLWFVGTSFGDNQPQRLYTYDVITGARTTTNINARPSRARTWIANGFNGSVYITDYNNVSVNRYDVQTAAFVQTVRTNAFPTYINSGPDRRIWVSSFGGMISLVDWDDNEVHNDWSAGIGDDKRTKALQVDPTDGSKLWFIDNDGLLVRHDINTHDQLETGLIEDWQFSNTKLNTPITLWVSQEMVYQDELLSSHTIKPYIFLLQENTLIAWRLDRYLYREAFATINGQAAVVSSPQQYFGEQG